MRNIPGQRLRSLLVLCLLALLLGGCASQPSYHHGSSAYPYGYGSSAYGTGYGGAAVVDEVIYGGSPNLVVGGVGGAFVSNAFVSDYWYDPFWYLGPTFVLSHRYIPTYFAPRWGFPFYADYYWHYPSPRFGYYGGHGWAGHWYSPGHPRFVPYHVRDSYGWRPSRAATAREAVRLSYRPTGPRGVRDRRGFDRTLGTGDVRRPKAKVDRRSAREASRLAAPRSGASGVYRSRPVDRSRSARGSRAATPTRSQPRIEARSQARSQARSAANRSAGAAGSRASREASLRSAERATPAASLERSRDTSRTVTRSSSAAARQGSRQFANPARSSSRPETARPRASTGRTIESFVRRSPESRPPVSTSNVRSRNGPRHFAAPTAATRPATRTQAGTRQTAPVMRTAPVSSRPAVRSRSPAARAPSTRPAVSTYRPRPAAAPSPRPRSAPAPSRSYRAPAPRSAPASSAPPRQRSQPSSPARPTSRPARRPR